MKAERFRIGTFEALVCVVLEVDMEDEEARNVCESVLSFEHFWGLCV